MTTAFVFRLNLIARNKSTLHSLFELFFPFGTVKTASFLQSRRQSFIQGGFSICKPAFGWTLYH